VQLEQYKVINTIEALELERDKIYYPLFRVYGVYGAYPNEQSKTILIGQLIGKHKLMGKLYPLTNILLILNIQKTKTLIFHSLYKKKPKKLIFHITKFNRIHI
jgi:hypothetical protein